ncbi:phage tail tape measure protein [Allobaculum stercoricanis]|uniref:phage tail tape measure protein n=1 Tax=Allobaculum stercoricanis TaxID=174709 RepID=UPI00294345E5|nr:phage tail tape measure protein [Allobaculum stercoricanis]
MAGSIKGITIEIDGDTKKLSEALKEPSKASKQLKTDLRNINSALKFDTNNVDLLNQKQTILKSAISDTEKELSLLKEAQRQYIESGKDINDSGYIQLEKEIAAVSRSLENLKNQQSDLSGELVSFANKVNDFGSKTEALGKKFLPVTAGVAAIGTAAHTAWSELDEAYDGIAAGTGATGEALERLQAIFDNVYGNFPADSAEVGTAIADLNTRFGFTGEQLETASTQFLKFAQVNNTDVGTAIAKVSRAMGDAGVSSEEYGHVLDALTAASQGSGLATDVLAESLTKFGAPMRQLGFSMEESIALFSQWEKAGVNTEIAFSGMKKAISNWSAAGKDAKVEFASMMKQIEEAPDLASATTLAIEAFGQKAGPDLADAIKGGRFSIEEFTEIVAKSGGQLDDTFMAMLDPADQMTVAMNNLKLAGADLGDAIQSVLAPMLNSLAKACQGLAKWFKGLDDDQKELIVKLGLVAAAIGPVLMGVGRLSIGFSTMMLTMGKVSTVFKGLITTIGGISTPVLAVGAAIAGLVAAFVTLWNTNEEFRNKITEIWGNITEIFSGFADGIVQRLNDLGFDFENIGEAIQTVWQGLCDFLAPVFTGALEIVQAAFQTFSDVFFGVWDTLKALFEGDWDGFWNGISEIFNGIWEGIGEAVSAVIDTITGIVEEFLSWFGIEWDFTGVQEAWETTWGAIGSFFQGIIETIQGVVSAFISLFTGDWDGFTSAISETWSNVWNGISSFASGCWEGIQQTANDIFTAVEGFFSDTWNNIKKTAEDTWNNTKKFLGDTWESIKGTAKDTWDSMCSTAGRIWDDIKNTVTGKAKETHDEVTTTFESTKTVSETAMANMANGIANSVTTAATTILTQCGNIKAAVDGLPSRKYVNIYTNHIETYTDRGLHTKGGTIPMATGGIFTKPTLIPALERGKNDHLVGEAGPEAVLPIRDLYPMIEEAAQTAMFDVIGGAKVEVAGVGGIDYDKLAGTLVKSLSGIKAEFTTHLNGKTIARETAPIIDRELAKLAMAR